jgi:tRNA modification GTPase
VPDGLMTRIMPDLERLLLAIERHLVDGQRGERLRTGLELALVGPTNAGKSSLINLLSKRDVAIVTEIPGTTRDILEASLDLGGYPLTMIDMAGLRETADPVEAIGVERARGRARDADFLLLLFDASTWPQLDPETLALIDDRALVVLNKIDLLLDPCPLEVAGREAIGISCRTGAGLDRLEAALTSLAAESMALGDAPMLTRARHRDALAEVAAALRRIVAGGASLELALTAEDVRIAMAAMGRITGRVRVEEVLDRIFFEFCIGK